MPSAFADHHGATAFRSLGEAAAHGRRAATALDVIQAINRVAIFMNFRDRYPFS
jgi:hypothetical protein